MKKLLFISALFLIFLSGYSQVPIGCPTCLTTIKGTLKVDSLFLLPLRNDTLINPGRPGAMVTAYGKTWLYTGTAWGLLTGISWGSIPGDITTQNDLMVLLNAKQNQITNGYAWKLTGGVGSVDTGILRRVDTVVQVNDSTFGFRINGGPLNNIKIRGSASGTVVNAISIAAPPALFSSPVVFTNASGAWSGTLTLIPQSANRVWAGPPNGSPDTPRFRALVPADLPINIPNGNLATPFMNFTLDNTGSAPNWDVVGVALGGTAILHIPYVSPSAAGIASSVMYNFWSSKVDSTVQSNDSVYEWRNGLRYYRYFNSGGGGGTPFDSLTAQGGIFHTGTYNDSRYRTFLDTTYAHLLMSRNWGYKISDSLAALITQKLTIGDTAYAHFLMTRAWGYKISDSIFAVVNTALALKRNKADTVGNTASATNGHLQKSLDSVNALLLHYSDSTYYSTFARLYKVRDSLMAAINVRLGAKQDTGVTFHLYIRRKGQPGDSLAVTASDSTLWIAALRDSLNFHHVYNPDGSVTMWSTGGGGSTDTLNLSHRIDSVSSHLGDTATLSLPGRMTAAEKAKIQRTLKLDTAGGTGHRDLVGIPGTGGSTVDTLRNLPMEVTGPDVTDNSNALHNSWAIADAVNPADTIGKWLNRIYRSHDSVYSCKGGTCTLAYIDSTGGGGGGSAKSSKSITGTGVTGDSLRLVNDLQTPGKGRAYMTRPGADSTKGYYEIEENAFGFFYSKGTWADATTGFVNKGSLSVAVSGGKLAVTNGRSDYSKALLIDGPIMVDKWEGGTIAKVVSKNAADSEGFAVGKFSLNGYGAGSNINLTAKFFMNSGANSGKITINGSAGIVLATSSGALSFSIGDSILLTLDRDGYNVTGTIRNLTTNSSPVYVYYSFSTSLGDTPQPMENTGDVAAFGLGGSFTIDSLWSYTKAPSNARLMAAGDSKLQGYYVTNQQDRLGDILNNRIKSTVIWAGGSDRLRELAMCIPQIIRMRPQQLLNLSGSNQIRFGSDSTTYCTLYDSINTAFRTAGVDVITGVLYESSVDVSKLWNHIQQVENSAKIIDLITPLKQPGILAPDNVHLLSFGDSTAAATIIRSGKIYGTNHRYDVPSNAYVRNQYRTLQTADYNITGNASAASFTAGNVKIVRGVTTEASGNAVLGTTTGGVGFLSLTDSAGATDSKKFDFAGFSNHVYWRLQSDNAATATNIIDVTRSTTTVSNIKFTAPTIISPASGDALTIPIPASGNGMVNTYNVTGFVRPVFASGSATSGAQIYIGNSSTGSGAYSTVYVTTAGSGSGSPTFVVANAATGTQYYWGLNRNTDNWQLEKGTFFNEWGGTTTHLMIIKPSGQVNIGGSIGNDMLTVTGSTKITDTFKLPNIVRKLVDTTNLKPTVVDASGNTWKTDWATFASGFTNPMTTVGDIIYGGTSGAATRLAGNTTTTKQFYQSTGTGSAATAPTLGALVSGDIPNNAANTSGTAANLSGTPALPNGTTASTQAAHDSTTKIADNLYVDRAVAQNSTGGTYTPTIAGTANYTSSSTAVFQYIKSGNIVWVRGRVFINPTAGSTITGFSVTLPPGFATTVSSVDDMIGSGTAVGLTTNTGAYVVGQPGVSTIALVSFISEASGSSNVRFSFSYILQ